MQQEGSVIKLSLSGINRSGSIATSKEGSCNEVIGMEYKDGNLVPFEPVRTSCSVSGVEKIWVHKTSLQNNYIYLKRSRSGVGELLWQTEEKALSGKSELTKIVDLPNGITKIDFLNNLFCYCKNVFLFKEGAYKHMSYSDIDFGMSVSAQGNGVAVMYDSILFPDDSADNEKRIQKYAKEADIVSRINSNFQILEGEVSRGEYISGACCLRYALRMYDGSYICASQPVLVMPDTYYENINGYSYRNGFDFNLRSGWRHTIDKLVSPQCNIIPSFFGSTVFWSMLNFYDENGKIKRAYREVFDEVNDAIKNERSLEYSHYWQDTPEISPANLHWDDYVYQKLNFDYWLLNKGTTGFRERYQFNNPDFNKKNFYYYDSSNKTFTCWYEQYHFNICNSDAESADFPSIGGERTDVSYYNDELGWTWGVIPNLVSWIPTKFGDNSGKLNTLINWNTMMMTASVSGLGQNVLQNMVKKANTTEARLYASSSDSTFNNVGSPYSTDSSQWFSNMWGLQDGVTTTYIGGATPANKPYNYHIGELGFCTWNNNRFEGTDLNLLSNNMTMVFGRELYTPVYRITQNIKEEYKDLITSVDIFMTPPVSIHEDGYPESSSFFSMKAHRPYKNKSKVLDEVGKTLGDFHLIHSIPFDALLKHKEHRTIFPYIERGKISNVRSQKQLVEYGRSSYDYGVSFVYNNKLHIADIKEQFFGWYKDRVWSMSLCSDSTGILTDSDNHPSYNCAQKVRAIDNRVNVIQSRIGSIHSVWSLRCYLYGYVDLLIDGEHQTVHFKREFNGLQERVFSGGVYYPDYRAERIHLTCVEMTDEVNGIYKYAPIDYVVDLEPNERCNFSYNTNGDIDSFLDNTNLLSYTFKDRDGVYSELVKEATLKSSIKRDSSIFKVSSTNNPLVFPYAQTYRVGFGDIIGFSNTSVAVSQGQFGVYPLLVFTTEGIFAMNVDTSGVGSYLTNAPISREVCNNANSIVQVDGGVFFSSDKGLMLISGSDTQLFSESINGVPENTPDSKSDILGDGLKVYSNAISHVSLVTLEGAISYNDFREYLKQSSSYISYLYDKGKLLVYNSTFDYCYLIDLSTRFCTKLSKRVVFNTDDYPSSLYATGDYLYQFSIDGASLPNDCMIQTRPIMIGDNDLKSSYRVVLRGLFYGEMGKYSGFYVMGSLDGKRWMYLGGTERKHLVDTPVKDIGTTIERNSCKFLMAVYVGSLLPESKIENIEITLNNKYNDKIR